MASWEAHVGYYEGLGQNFVPDHQVLLGYSVVRQILPYNHHLWALFCYKPSRNALFTCFYREFGFVLVRDSMICNFEKRNFPLDLMSFFQK